MKFITITELRLKATEIIRDIESTKEEVIVTKKGKPVILMQFITDEAFSLKEKEAERKKSVTKSVYQRGKVHRTKLHISAQ